MSVFIDSKIVFGEKVEFSEEEKKFIPTEQMVRSMDYQNFVNMYVKGDVPLTAQAIIDIDWNWFKNRKFWTIDTRVHMLMEGMYPCIPGWHHDDVPRTRSDKQPNYDDELRCEHAMFLLNAHVAPTKFAIGVVPFSEVNSGEVAYRKWHSEVEEEIQNGGLEEIECPDSQWVYFDDRTWHAGTMCKVPFGHRLFIRIGMHYRMIDGKKVYEQPPTRANEIRRNAQVYMNNPMQGW